jgi:hypothetical protein
MFGLSLVFTLILMTLCPTPALARVAARLRKK